MWESASGNSKQPPTGTVLLYPSHSEVESLEVNFSHKLLVTSSYHHVVPVASSSPCANEGLALVPGGAVGEALGDSWSRWSQRSTNQETENEPVI